MLPGTIYGTTQTGEEKYFEVPGKQEKGEAKTKKKYL